MASSLIGSLRVALGLDTAQFEAGANKATRIARTKAGEMQASFANARRAVEGLFAAFTVGLVAEQIKKSLEYAGSLAEVSRTLGVTTKDLQTFRFVASQTGVSQEVLENSLRKLTVSMGKAQLGSKAQIEAFNAIGISVNQLKGKTTGDIFRLMADGLSKVTDRSQRAAIEVALLKKGGEQLDNALVGGSKRINELSEAAERLGIVLSDEQIRGAEETAHKLEAVKQVLSAQIAGVVANNASAILSLSSALATLTGQIVRFLGSNPQLALGIIGALLGGRVGGLPGAVIGGAAGAFLGGKLSQSLLDSNPNLTVRTQQMRAAQQKYLQALRSPDLGGRALPGIGTQASAGGAKNVAAARSEFVRQIGLLQQATAQARAGQAPRPPGVNLPKIFAPEHKEKKPKKGPEDRSEEIAFQSAQELRQADMAILHAKQQLAGSAEQRAQIELQLIQLEHDSQAAEIDHKLAQAQKDFAEHKITKATLDQVTAQAAILRAKNDEKAQIERQAFIEEQLTRQEQAQFEATKQRYDFALDSLHTADDLATTQRDHRRIQLQILDAEIEQRRLELEHAKQLAIRNGATKKEIDNLQAQIDHLPAERAQGAARINLNTQSPLEAFFKSIPQNAQEIGAALEGFAVKGLEDFNDQLTDAIVNAKSLRDVFHAVASSILQDLIKLALQEAELQIFKAFSGGLGGGFNVGGLESSNAVGLGLPANFFRASGGPVSAGRPYFVGERGIELFMPKVSGTIIPNSKLNFANDDMPMGQPHVAMTMHNDFRGVDASSVAAIQARLDRMQSELPATVMATMSDARDRFVWKSKR